MLSWGSYLGAMIGYLGVMLGHLGAMLAHLGAMLGHLGADLGQVGAKTLQRRKNTRKLEKNVRKSAPKTLLKIFNPTKPTYRCLVDRRAMRTYVHKLIQRMLTIATHLRPHIATATEAATATTTTTSHHLPRPTLFALFSPAHTQRMRWTAHSVV